MTAPEDILEAPANAVEGAAEATDSPEFGLPPAPEGAMDGYFRLQQNLLFCTLGFTAVIFVCVWGFYSLHIALNYLIGASTGVVYLRMLAKNVGEIGRERGKVGSGHIAVFIGVMIVATQWNQLEILPVFLGFLTYKAALISYTLWTAILPP